MMSRDEEIVELNHSLDLERAALAASQRADAEGRVTDRDRWTAVMNRRRAHILALTTRRDLLIALEESQADLNNPPTQEGEPA